MKRMKDILLCPWVERMIHPETWKEIKDRAKLVTGELLPNGLTKYEILDNQQKVIEVFYD